MILRMLLRRRLAELLESTKNTNEDYLEIPLMAYNYAVRISKLTGLPLEEVVRSKPFRKYLEKMEKKVKLRLGTLAS